MTTAQVRSLIFKAFKTRVICMWFLLRVISAFGPLAITYIFAKGIEVFENGGSFNQVLNVFWILLVVQVVSHISRIGSKTRIALYAEGSLVFIQEEMLKSINPPENIRNDIIQTLRNLTQALRRLIIFFYNTGIEGVVSFVSIPIILFLIDVRVFGVEIVLIVLYMLSTFVFSKKYEVLYEKFDKARERYFSGLQLEHLIENRAKFVILNEKKVQDFAFFNWVSLQNLISVFHFVVIYIVVKDLAAGVKQISDLVLIVGYTKASKMFLNQVTSVVNKFMEVKAGIERVSAVSAPVSADTSNTAPPKKEAISSLI